MNEHISGEDLAAYVDELLGADKRDALESHFARCPECLDELVEIYVLKRGRDKVPAQFLKLALKEKSRITRPVLHLRLVFEVAAALVVVVFIGYLFLSNNRFWQAHQQQKTSVLSDQVVRPQNADAAVALGETVPPQKASVNDVAGMPAAKTVSVQTAGQKNPLQESMTEPEAVSNAQTDFAAKDRRVVKSKAEAVVQTRQNLDKQKNIVTGVERSNELQEEKLHDEASQLRASAAVLPAAEAAQPALEAKKQGAALGHQESAGKETMPPVLIEGDAAWTDLRNSELLITWHWFQKGLVLELWIDGAGTVIAVAPLGKIDPILARRAENEAKKLLFSVSKKKLRRARLHAGEKPFN